MLAVEYTKGSEAEAILEKYSATRNGKTAYHVMMKHMQSTSYMDSLCTSTAISKMNSTLYQGEKKDFGMARYFTIHTRQAHNDLETWLVCGTNK